MVAVARLSGQIGKSMETFVQNFQNWRLVVPLFSAWGFVQIREKTWSEFFQASPDVRLVVMVTFVVPRLAAWGYPRKDLARIFLVWSRD
jgi:hypothetical protein